MPRFESELQVGASPTEVFAFLCRPEKMVAISPPDIELMFFDPPEVIELGTLLQFQVRGFGQIQRVENEITEFAEGCFVEEQHSGPMRSWKHRHSVIPSGIGSIIRNEIDFEPPSGLLGLIATEPRLLKTIEDGTAHRHNRLSQIFGCEGTD